MRMGRILRRHRMLEERTLRDLGAEMQISHSTLSRVEQGLDCDGPTLMAILKWLTADEAAKPATDAAQSALALAPAVARDEEAEAEDERASEQHTRPHEQPEI